MACIIKFFLASYWSAGFERFRQNLDLDFYLQIVRKLRGFFKIIVSLRK